MKIRTKDQEHQTSRTAVTQSIKHTMPQKTREQEVEERKNNDNEE